jgi:hypothetical protein
MQPGVPPVGRGAEAEQAAIAKPGADVPQGGDATQGAKLKQGGEANQEAPAKEATGTIATSTTPPWQGMEQQE